MLERGNSPWVPLTLTLALYYCVLVLLLNRHDPAFFVQAGEHFVDVREAPANLSTVTPFTGYDGTFYYRLALDPFTREYEAFGIAFDNARYRHQRILYPLLAWIFSFGSPPLALYSLILVNFLALGLIGGLGGLYAQGEGRSALWGVAFSLYPGYLATLSRDLTEIVEALCVLAVLVSFQRGRNGWAVAALALALLAKESALLIALVAVATRVVPRLRGGGALTVRPLLVPIVLFGAWQIFLNWWWQGLTLASAARANVGLPLAGMIQGFQIATTAVGGSQLRWAVEVAGLTLLGVAALASWQDAVHAALVRWSWVASTVLLLLLTAQVWIEDWAFLRAASLFYLTTVALLLAGRGHRWPLVLASSGWAMIMAAFVLR